MRTFLYVTPNEINEDQFNELVSLCEAKYPNTHYGFCDSTYNLFCDVDNRVFWIDAIDETYSYGVDNNTQNAELGSYSEMVSLLINKPKSDLLYSEEDVKFFATRFAHQCRLHECASNHETCDLFDKWFNEQQKTF